MQNQCMTTVELKRLVLAVIVVPHFTGKRLQCGSRQKHQQFAYMRTATRTAEHFLDRFEKTMEQIQTDNSRIVRKNDVAGAI